MCLFSCFKKTYIPIPEDKNNLIIETLTIPIITTEIKPIMSYSTPRYSRVSSSFEYRHNNTNKYNFDKYHSNSFEELDLKN